MEDWTKKLFEEEFYNYPTGQLSRKIKSAKDLVSKIIIELDKPAGSKILDLCCGYGRYSLPISEVGYEVIGLDISERPISMARELSKNLKYPPLFVQGDMRKIPFSDRYFDGIINFSSSFGYFSDETNKKVIEEISRVLKQRGHLLIDLLNLPKFLKDFKSEYIREEETRVIHFSNEYNFHTHRLKSIWEYHYLDNKNLAKSYSIDLRLYSFEEINKVMESVGMRILRRFGDLSTSEYNQESERMVLLARKLT